MQYTVFDGGCPLASSLVPDLEDNARAIVSAEEFREALGQPPLGGEALNGIAGGCGAEALLLAAMPQAMLGLSDEALDRPALGNEAISMITSGCAVWPGTLA